MKKLISAKLAGNILIVFMTLIIVFHILVLFKLIPPEIIWGGQLNGNPTQFSLMELIAIVITVAFILVIAAKVHKSIKLRRLIYICVWFIFAYLLLNTLGNFTSEQFFENTILAPITLFMSFFTFRLAIEK
jgi:hypothetical protein